MKIISAVFLSIFLFPLVSLSGGVPEDMPQQSIIVLPDSDITEGGSSWTVPIAVAALSAGGVIIAALIGRNRRDN